MFNKKITIGIIALILIAGIGIYFAKKVPKKESNPVQLTSPQTALEEKAETQPTKETFPPKMTAGIVQNISLKDGVIAIKKIAASGSANQADEIVMIQITKNTKYYQLTKKSPEEYQKETEEFNQKKQSATEEEIQTMISPQEYAEKEISSAGIIEGQIITAMASEDIGDKKVFMATKITVTN